MVSSDFSVLFYISLKFSSIIYGVDETYFSCLFIVLFIYFSDLLLILTFTGSLLDNATYYLLVLVRYPKENWGERLTVTISITFLAMLMLACLLIMIKQAVFTAWPTKKKDPVDVLVLVCHSRIGHDQIPMYFPWQPIHFICGSSVLFSRKLEKNSFLKL